MSVLDAARVHLADAQIRSIARSTARVNVWTGSIRSGKTVASLLRWVIYVASAPTGGELLVIGRTRESIARNVFGPLQDASLFGPIAKHVKYTPGAPTATILGRIVHVIGASNALAENVIRGVTCVGAYVDEATLISEGFWVMLLGRMSSPGAQLFATTNPDGPAHWFKTGVVDRAAELGYRVFRFKLADNTHLDAAYVAQITREYVGLWYRRFILGEWVLAEGAVYDQWRPEHHVIPLASMPPLDRILGLGVDYGTTNPTRGVLLGVGAGKLWAFDEWVPKRLTDAHLSADLRAWLRLEPRRSAPPEWIYVDPAAASLKMQLWEDGVRNVTDATNDVTDGIRTVSSLLATRQLVVADTCQALIGEVPGYSWDAKATAKGEDKPMKANDHSLDGLRYVVHSTRHLWGRAISHPLREAA